MKAALEFRVHFIRVMRFGVSSTYFSYKCNDWDERNLRRRAAQSSTILSGKFLSIKKEAVWDVLYTQKNFTLYFRELGQKQIKALK
ncbi:unnamed protein product [Acanthoscelides obtectus]|uniref:Uncharacterized protein n=1 Tax=Acanthoscelides obtectus TaxID=200917 RepID=A0A9P0K5H1_ACAOB|nr:unnamed protein product [Acanthoscelides obtectus]CAK1666571.1 hypothetical protein AOBTE_LOCUS25376 [Acanthoscelides obtectus]